MSTLGKVSVELYDTAGTTRLEFLEKATDARFLDQLSRPGSCSFSLPVDDPKRTQLTDYRVVKMLWNGLTFGHRLSPEQTWTHEDGKGRVTYAGPGLGSLLDDAVLYPEFPISRLSEDTRGFGPYSLSGVWKTADTGWVTPQTTLWSADTTRRAGFPRGVGKLAPSAAWIAVTNPSTDVADGTVNWARKGFTLAAATDVMVCWTADNYVDQWLDGRLIGEADNDIRGWRKLKRERLRLGAGSHQLAARFQNAATTSGSNPIGYLCIVVSLDAAGKPDQVLLKTNNTWDVHDNDPEPGWFRGQVLHKIMSEAQARAVKGALALALGFTPSADSASVAWAGVRDTFEFPVGAPCGEVAATLAEERMDWWVDAAAMILHAYDRKGANKATGASTVRLFLPQGLKGYQTSRRHARKTAVLGKRANGRWKEVTDTSGIASHGRMEAGASVAVAGSEGTLASIANTLLRRSATPQVEATVSGSALVGPLPGSAYVLGDSILVPAHTGAGHMKARVLGISVAQTGDSVTAYPIFTLDGT